MVAAIPAGLLAYLLVMVFLTKADGLPTILQILVGLTLACAALVALMPIALLIFGGKRAPREDSDKSSAKSGKAAKDDDGEVEAAEEIEDAGDEEASAFDIEESDADITADSDAEISGNDSSLDEIESVDFDEDDEDDEPAPKKRKK